MAELMPRHIRQWRKDAAARGNMVVDWFHVPDSKNFTKDKGAVTYAVEVPLDATLAQILEAGYSQGCPRGSGRAGCVEIQTDYGVWTSPTRSRLNPSTAVYKTWEQLAQEEQDEDRVA